MEPTSPFGQRGAPDHALKTGWAEYPSRVISARAAMRPAPLARRTFATLAAESSSPGSSAFSSPSDITRQPTLTPGIASEPMASSSDTMASDWLMREHRRSTAPQAPQRVAPLGKPCAGGRYDRCCVRQPGRNLATCAVRRDGDLVSDCRVDARGQGDGVRYRKRFAARGRRRLAQLVDHVYGLADRDDRRRVGRADLADDGAAGMDADGNIDFASVFASEPM